MGVFDWIVPGLRLVIERLFFCRVADVFRGMQLEMNVSSCREESEISSIDFLLRQLKIV
jgi:hypothetical protein